MTGLRPYLRSVDRARAIRELPAAYAQALALRDEGAEDGVIAERLAVAPEAIPALLELADAKLTRILASSNGSKSDPKNEHPNAHDRQVLQPQSP